MMYMIEGILSIVLVVLILAAWVHFITWPLRKRRAGPVMLDLGRSKIRLILGLFSAIFFAAIFLSAFRGGGMFQFPTLSLLDKIVLGLCWLSSVAISLDIGLTKLEMRERGILHFGEFLKWERIESYEWKGKKGHTLKVRARWRLSFLGTFTKRWSISPVHKDTREASM